MQICQTHSALTVIYYFDNVLCKVSDMNITMKIQKVLGQKSSNKQTSSSIHLYSVCLIIAVKSGVFSCILKVVLVTVDRMEVKEGDSVLYHDRTSRRRSFTGST